MMGRRVRVLGNMTSLRGCLYAEIATVRPDPGSPRVARRAGVVAGTPASGEHAAVSPRSLWPIFSLDPPSYFGTRQPAPSS
jgi:hypothetical protein